MHLNQICLDSWFLALESKKRFLALESKKKGSWLLNLKKKFLALESKKGS
jgi:hypothetical protein